LIFNFDIQAILMLETSVDFWVILKDSSPVTTFYKMSGHVFDKQNTISMKYLLQPKKQTES